MKRRTGPVELSTSDFLDQPHDFFHDPQALKDYRAALAAPDLKNGTLPEEIGVEWKNLRGVKTAFLRFRGAPKGKLLFHIHGGGWCGGVPCTGLQGMISLQQRLGVDMTSLEYGLAPEHPFPDGLDDCIRAYQGVLDLGYDPENIVLTGESAGGYYCLALTQWLKDHGLPLPAGLCLVSPGVEMADLSALKAAYEADPNDPMVGQMYAFNKWYIGSTPADAPYLSPINGSFDKFPPVLIQSGGCDFLRDDCARLAEKMGRSGVDVRYHSWEYLPHVFFLLDIPEAERGRKELAEFVAELLEL